MYKKRYLKSKQVYLVKMSTVKRKGKGKKMEGIFRSTS